MASAPGYTCWLPLPYGALRAAIRRPLEFQLDARERFGGIVRLQVGPYKTHFLYLPDHVARVLRDRQKNYLRGWQSNLLRRLFSDNLVVSEGEYWRRQRRLAQPAFSQQRLTAYADVMVAATAELLTRWKKTTALEATIDVAPAMSRLALAIAGLILFSKDVSLVECPRNRPCFRDTFRCIRKRWSRAI